jgi:cytochrome P450
MGEVMTDETEVPADPADAMDAGLEQLLNLVAPQPGYRQVIEEGGCLQPMDGLTLTFSRALTDHVLRHHELFSSVGGLDLGNIRPLIPLNVDPPEHSKYRKILDPLFAPKQMDAQEADITARVNHFIDAFVDRGECNFTEEFAELLPSSVFLGLMGLPWEELETLLHLRDGILRPHKIDPDAMFFADKRLAVMRATGRDIYEYFDKVCDERAHHPTDDILSHLVTVDIAGEKLAREEILDICFLFLIAGLDTVSDSLTCFYAFLANHPGHRRQLVEDPALIPGAVEELLRWESPVPSGVPRIATRDTELPNGVHVAAGTAVMVNYGAANVDPAEFSDAFDVRFDRATNRHIAFGAGVHRCLGSHLARRELRITLREWHRRIPDYSIKPGHEELVYPPGLRSVQDLTLVWPV